MRCSADLRGQPDDQVAADATRGRPAGEARLSARGNPKSAWRPQLSSGIRMASSRISAPPGRMADAPRVTCERNPMPVRFQLVIDCADPDRLARFWAAALGYQLAPPPAGFATWNDYYRDLGVPEEDLVGGADRISDPDGDGPSIWFNSVQGPKVVKNRL